ncbi:Cell division control protein 1 [Termitomyces sp. J132]|nr:Cell division control protein 1 [Termitomyces sp. J132]
MNHRVVNGLRIVWVIVTLWYELGVFFKSVSSCNWPDAVLRSSPHVTNTPSHVLLIADPQILDHRSYPERGPFLTYLSRLVVDLNLRKAWWVALRKQPDVVIFLGDMMDGGRIDMTDDEYEDYYQRFNHIFRLPSGLPTYFIPGNHDIGLRASSLFSPHARSRYQSHFGYLNSWILVANHTFVLLDAPTFVEEDEQRVKSGHAYQDWTPRHGGPIEFVTTVARGENQNYPIVLMSHIPLARTSFDCGPLREKGTIRPGAALGYQNTLGKEATAFLLETLHPSVVFSGDDHDYCENYHTSGWRGATTRVREISVKSFSMAMGIKKPGFQLLSLVSPIHGEDDQKTLADVPCFLPDQMSIYLSTYIPLLLVSLFIVLGSNALRVHTLPPKRSRRLSSPHPRRGDDASEDRMTSLPQPVSVRTPKSGSRPQIPSSFVLFGRRRHIMCFDLLRHCLTLCRTSRRLNSEGLWFGFLRDSRDIAVFPLTVFVAISFWITIT